MGKLVIFFGSIIAGLVAFLMFFLLSDEDVAYAAIAGMIGVTVWSLATLAIFSGRQEERV
jgi:hypothetical protein